ncbi:MAG: helix-turn-helix transcriptional regulator [Aestuariivita sp.]|nr:helix-turn-helix transcriptional regulator [Aestuariivita sp.]
MSSDNAGWYSPEVATFGDRIAYARDAANMSRTTLARKLGVHRDTVIAWEEDRSDPRANKLSMMAGVLNVSIMWLLSGKGDGMELPQIDGLVQEEIMTVAEELNTLRSDLRVAEEFVTSLRSRLMVLLDGKIT